MRQKFIGNILRVLVVFPIFLILLSTCILAQNKCFTKEEAEKVINSIKIPSVAKEQKDVRRELLKMVETREKLNQKIAGNLDKNKSLIVEFNKLGETQLLRLCQIVKEKGWLTKDSIKEDGVEAMLSIIRNNRAYVMQTEFYPILLEAANKGYIFKGNVASLIDSIRVAVGQPQIFGTQAKIKDEIIYLNPILNEEKVDEWRKQYDLPTLANFIRQLEARYLFPVLKSPRLAIKPNLKTTEDEQETTLLGISNDEEEVLKIDTRLVNLNVRILNKDYSIPKELNLVKEDFTVLEDGQEQEIAFFSTTEAPFDLILLLDFSGSTVEKRGLIKQAAQRFVEVARPADRIAIIAFTHETQVISNLTTERNSLIEKINAIDMTGGSAIWESVKFAYANLLKKESLGRRSAVVLMTDAIDNSRNVTFADLFEMVQNNDTTIFPVYLDDGVTYSEISGRIKRKSKQTLTMLAEESGGTAYAARNVKDLRGIYEQIINDLGKVYSVGYEPKNEGRDGSWRNLTVKLKNRTDLIIRTRRGYYAK